MSKILIISSHIHKELSPLQLAKCEALVKQASYDYQVETLAAGTYEIPFVINAYQQKKPFDAYIALGLVLNTNQAHYDYIMSHIQYTFSNFAMNHIIVGNGIVAGSSLEELTSKIASQDPCQCAYPSAFNAVDCLLKLQKKLA